MRQSRSYLLPPIAVLFIIILFNNTAFAQCGVERWSVKTGTDPDAGQVNLNAPTSTPISNLTSLPAPNPIPPNNRVAPTEDTLWVINATLTQYKLESDSDYHLVLTSVRDKKLTNQPKFFDIVIQTWLFLAPTVSG